MRRIRLALVDECTLLREALSACLREQDGFEVAWSTASLQQARHLILEHQPDILLLEIDQQIREACDLIRQVDASSSPTRIIVLTHNQSDVLVARTLDLRVSGYILKDDSLQNLREGIRRVLQGDAFYSEKVGRKLRLDTTGTRRGDPAADNPLRQLTPHQLQLVGHIAQGATAKQIAQLMHVSVTSINSQKYRIMRRLGVHDRVQLAHLAIREGLIRP